MRSLLLLQSSVTIVTLLTPVACSLQVLQLVHWLAHSQRSTKPNIDSYRHSMKFREGTTRFSKGMATKPKSTWL